MYLSNEDRLLFNLVFVRGCTDYQALAGIFGIAGMNRHFIGDAKHSGEVLPDFCLGCLTSYGDTVGGRARRGCHQCNQYYTLDSELYKKYTSWGMLTQNVNDALLCHAYRRYMACK